jgi:hypothetical protein
MTPFSTQLGHWTGDWMILEPDVQFRRVAVPSRPRPIWRIRNVAPDAGLSSSGNRSLLRASITRQILILRILGSRLY